MLHNTLMKKVGINYIIYSSIAARTVRMALKEEFLKDAQIRDKGIIRIYKFVDGRRGPEVQTLRPVPPEDEKEMVVKPSQRARA